MFYKAPEFSCWLLLCCFKIQSMDLWIEWFPLFLHFHITHHWVRLKYHPNTVPANGTTQPFIKVVVQYIFCNLRGSIKLLDRIIDNISKTVISAMIPINTCHLSHHSSINWICGYFLVYIREQSSTILFRCFTHTFHSPLYRAFIFINLLLIIICNEFNFTRKIS